MKRYVPLLVVVLAAVLLNTGCNSSAWDDYRGQLLGVQDRPKWEPINPYGMVYIPSGFLHIGPSDQDVNNSLVQRSKAVSVQGFYMDDAEITNNEYRQFVFWVRDSIAHTLLGQFEDQGDNKTEQPVIDWSQDIGWDDPDNRTKLQEMFLPASETYYGRESIDPRGLIFTYRWVRWKDAASKTDNPDLDKSISEYISEESVHVYPDTLVWVRDFTYSFNEPMTRQYFSHPAFDDYPVVGVNWKQANAFASWRTGFWNNWRINHKEVIVDDFRLPTETEWEYAARGGREDAPYPWGGPYVRNTKGCYLANFKPGRGNYPEDGGYYTVKVYSYAPNDYGLYNMAGNVSEWTSSAYAENAYAFIHDEDPDYRYDADENDPPAMKRKVIRGGSWKDISYYIQTGTRHWEYQDTAKSYIGFRCCMTFLGRSMSDF